MENWGNAEIEMLKNLYKENDVPSDQLIKDKDALSRFVEALNQRIGPGKSYTDKEIAGEILKLRKGKKLPRIRK
jgi:hypothetical protein